MVFDFLKYLKPIWYFNRRPDTNFGYFPTEKQLKNAGYSLEKDGRYQSEEARNRDLGWTAFQQGFISKTNESGYNMWQKCKIPVFDEYVFLRKNFHQAWVIYVLLIRIVTFHNPFREFLCFFQTSKIKRFDCAKNHFVYSDYDTFESSLLKENPLISVIIPTLNRYEYLKEVLKDFENQTYKNFEIIIVDQSEPFQKDFYEGWNFNLRYWFQEEKALWLARNEAIQSSKGNYLLMSEDDIRIPSDLIENHIRVFDFFNCDVSCGIFFPEGETIPKEKNYFKYAEQFATGNAFLKKELFKKIGLFDRQFEKQRMGDGEFGLRAYLNGFLMVSNPFAFCIDVKAPEGGLRISGGSWDSWRPKKFFGPRPVPSVLYLSRKYFGNRLTKFYILHSILPSLVPYKFKGNKLLKGLAFLLVPFLLPLIFYQVLKSWNLATEKLKEGDKISEF